MVATYSRLVLVSIETTSIKRALVNAVNLTEPKTVIRGGDNRFRFCLQYSGTHHNGDTGNCPLGGYSTGEVGDDSFTFRNWISRRRGIPNPMMFAGAVWPVSESVEGMCSVQLGVLYMQ